MDLNPLTIGDFPSKFTWKPVRVPEDEFRLAGDLDI